MLIRAILTFVVLAAVALRAQDPVFTLQVEVPLVSLDVAVLDAKNRPLVTLGKEAFSVFEDGQPREIHNFAPVDAAYNVVLLLDRSGSTSNDQPLLEKAFDRFLSKRRPQDRIITAAFDHTVTVLSGSANPANIPAKHMSAQPGSQTDLYGAMAWALAEMEGLTGRKAVIVYTDGVDWHITNRRKAADDAAYQKILRAIEQSGVAFNFVAVNTDRNPSRVKPTAFIQWLLPDARARMEEIAEVSGGRILFPQRVDDVSSLYDQIARELAASYSIGFVPAAALPGDKPHRIEVRVNDKNLHVWQSKTSYTLRQPVR